MLFQASKFYGFLCWNKLLFFKMRFLYPYSYYLQKTEKGDCNEDGKIDCIDFAYMHRLGGYSCKDASFTKTAFYDRFMTCWKVVQEAMPQTTTSSSNSSSISWTVFLLSPLMEIYGVYCSFCYQFINVQFKFY